MNVNTHEKTLAENSKSFNWASKLFPKEERNSIALLYFFVEHLMMLLTKKVGITQLY